MYYKIQFPPYEHFKKNYLSYSRDKGFYLAGYGSGLYFLESALIEDKDLVEYLLGKEYRLVECDRAYDPFKYRGVFK